MVDEYSGIKDRDRLYKEMDEHIRSSRRSEKKIFSGGRPGPEEKIVSAYGSVYEGKKKSAFHRFLEFLIFRKRQEDYEELEGSADEIKEKFTEDMEELEKEEKLIHDAEEEVSKRKRQNVWQLLASIFKGRRTKAEKEQAEKEFMEEYGELEEEEKLLEAEEEKTLRQRKGIIWNLLHHLRIISQPAIEAETEEEKSEKEYPEVTELRNDMKSVAIFSMELLKRLSKHQIETLKDKEDFKRFKEVLKKHKVIK